MSPETRSELLELLEAFCRNDLTAAQQARMEAIVVADADARKLYVRYLHMQVCLREAMGGAAVATTEQPLSLGGRGMDEGVSRFAPLAQTLPQRGGGVNTSATPLADEEKGRTGEEEIGSGSQSPLLPFSSSPLLRRAWLRIAAALALAAGAAWWVMSSPTEVQAGPPAVLTTAAGCTWAGSSAAPQVGAAMPAGRWTLTAGLAQLTFRCGAVVLLEAPAELEILGPAEGYLHSGRLVARADGKAGGFVIATQGARVLNEGTEFGMDVGGAGEILLQVFEGRVEADFAGAGTGDAAKRTLTAGQAIALGGPAGSAPRTTEFAPERFIRRFPDPVLDKAGRLTDRSLVPYNSTVTAGIDIVRAPGEMKIDGDLTDWGDAAGFRSRCAEPYGAGYSAEGRLMYDDQFLYIAAHVRDPAPMRSAIDPAKDPGDGWMGGGVQVRISTDAALGWPVDAEAGWVRGGRNRTSADKAAENNRNLAHLTLWHYRPTGQACLHVAYGTRLQSAVINPAGFRGAFRADADGLGYTMEYAVPWSLLNTAGKHPAAGATTAACWNVHWSDEGGRRWKGYVVDVLNPAAVRGLPDENTRTYARAITWGRAVWK